MHYIYLLPAAFLAPVIHEAVKALCSASLGDPTPKNKGFRTGNPFKYFEAVGFFCILIFGYGWGQPVPTSPLYYKDRRRGVLITYITPSVVNLLVGLITAALMNLLNILLMRQFPGGLPSAWAGDAVNVVFQVMYRFALCNVGLALFNLIPVFPLDGAKILQMYLKPDWAVRMNQYEKICQMILLILLGLGLVARVFDPISEACVHLVFR